MRQPIKFLPYFGNTGRGRNNIARFKGLSVNCDTIGESWELSAVPGKQSIVADGDNAGMELQALVESLKGNLVGEGVYSFYGGEFPLNLKLVDEESRLTVEVSERIADQPTVFQYCPENRDDSAAVSHPLVSGPCFSVCREEVEGERTLENPRDSFMGLLCLEGEGQLKVDGVSTPVKKGETLLLPAPVNEFDVKGALSILTVVSLIPDSISM